MQTGGRGTARATAEAVGLDPGGATNGVPARNEDSGYNIGRKV